MDRKHLFYVITDYVLSTIRSNVMIRIFDIWITKQRFKSTLMKMCDSYKSEREKEREKLLK